MHECHCGGCAQGGREGRDIGAVELAKAVEVLGTGEILLNCIDCDGAKQVGALRSSSAREASVPNWAAACMVLR